MGSVLDETCFLLSAHLLDPRTSCGQRSGQKPERDGREQSYDPSYEVAQPPGTHPSGICWCNGDGVYVGETQRKKAYKDIK